LIRASAVVKRQFIRTAWWAVAGVRAATAKSKALRQREAEGHAVSPEVPAALSPDQTDAITGALASSSCEPASAAPNLAPKLCQAL